VRTSRHPFLLTLIIAAESVDTYEAVVYKLNDLLNCQIIAQRSKRLQGSIERAVGRLVDERLGVGKDGRQLDVLQNLQCKQSMQVMLECLGDE
jgi:hypothetical protein